MTRRAPSTSDSRGILRPQTGLRHFEHERRDAPPALRPYVEWFWAVSWDLGDGERYVQELVPYLAVNLSIRHGDGPHINGPCRRRTERVLEGQGSVVAALFTPAGFRPIVGGDQRRFVDRIVPGADELGAVADAWREADGALEGDDVAARFDLLADVLVDLVAERAVEPDPTTALVNEAARRIRTDPSITRVDQLATTANIGVRQLQRLFAEHVGVGPKLLIQRHRLQESAERVARGEAVRWADVAQQLGFADQAHLTRAFTATIGVPPERYARECQASTTASVGEPAPTGGPS